jgi:transcriptional regulator GlxA family with amidase domain
MNMPNSCDIRPDQPTMTIKKQNVGILLFNGVELLDFAGPFEVFSRTRLLPGVESRLTDETAPFCVFTVAKSAGPIDVTGQLKVLPSHSFQSVPSIDVLVVPGGYGTRTLVNDRETLDWIRAISSTALKVTSVCTGSLLLAQAGLLNGRRATTHWGAVELLQQISDSVGANISIQEGARFVDDGVISSAGISAGIDMALYVVEKICGAAVAAETARYMEFRRNPDH